MQLNVWCSTGTIGSYLNHPQRGKSQLFRREIYDHRDLREVFENPRVHGHGGYYERQQHSQQQAEWQRQTERQAAAEAAEEWEWSETRRVQQARGTRQCYSIQSIYHEGTEIDFSSTTTCVALGDNNIMMFHESGGWSWNGTPTKLLHNKLQGRQSHLPAPTYVSLSADDRYYIEFSDGKSEWVAPDSFGDKIHAESRDVLSVAFGEDWDTWFVVFNNGYWGCGGNIPDGLLQRLASRNHRGDLTFVSLGPSGEWFVSAQNGKTWWGGVDDDQLDLASPYRERITSMVFGGSRDIHIRYN